MPSRFLVIDIPMDAAQPVEQVMDTAQSGAAVDILEIQADAAGTLCGLFVEVFRDCLKIRGIDLAGYCKYIHGHAGVLDLNSSMRSFPLIKCLWYFRGPRHGID